MECSMEYPGIILRDEAAVLIAFVAPRLGLDSFLGLTSQRMVIARKED